MRSLVFAAAMVCLPQLATAQEPPTTESFMEIRSTFGDYPHLYLYVGDVYDEATGELMPAALHFSPQGYTINYGNDVEDSWVIATKITSPEENRMLVIEWQMNQMMLDMGEIADYGQYGLNPNCIDITLFYWDAWGVPYLMTGIFFQ